MSSLQQRIRDAGPAAGLDAAWPESEAEILALAKERAADATGSSERGDQLRWWSLAAAAVLIAVAGVAIGIGSRPPSITTANDPTVDLAKAYIAARNTGDLAAADLVLHPGARIDEFPVLRDREDLAAAFDYWQLLEEEVRIGACEPTPGTTDEAVCAYQMESRLTRRVATAPVIGTFRFRTEDGRLIEVENTFDFLDHQIRVLDPLFVFVDRDRTGAAVENSFRFMFRGEEVIWSARLEDLEQLRVELDLYAPQE